MDFKVDNVNRRVGAYAQIEMFKPNNIQGSNNSEISPIDGEDSEKIIADSGMKQNIEEVQLIQNLFGVERGKIDILV